MAASATAAEVDLPLSSIDATAAKAASAGDGSYAFELVDVAACPSLSSSALKESWAKWDLQRLRSFCTLRFTSRFAVDESAAFLLDLFNSDALRAGLRACLAGTSPSALSGTISAVHFEPLRVTATSMDFFDRLSDAGIVVPAEDERLYIRKQLEEIYDGVAVADLLRDCLLNPDSEHSAIFGEADRQELLFRIFKHIVAGGSMSQYEDDAQAYLSAAKGLYKDLVSVGKDAATGKIAVTSFAFAVKGLAAAAGAAASDGGRSGGAGVQAHVQLFPAQKSGHDDGPHDVCWVTVHPAKRQCTVYHCAFVPYW